MQTRQTILIAVEDGSREVDANVFGDWAVHLWIFQWTVTHVPSGAALCWARDERHAKRIARRCAKEVPGDSLPDTLTGPYEYPLIDDRDRRAIRRIIDEEMPTLPDGPFPGDAAVLAPRPAGDPVRP